MNTGLLWSNLLAYSFQIGLLVGVTGFVPALLRLRWPGAKLVFWQILLAACLLLPLVRPWRREMIAVAGVSASTTVVAARPALPATRPIIPRSEIALLLLAAGVLGRLGWLGVGFWRLRRYRLGARAFRPVLSPDSKLPRSRNGCPAFLSDQISSPVTFGWREPVILLPARFPELDGRLQDAILCHELLHVERRDWLFTISEEVIRAIFWFHPAIWWLLGEIQLAREQAVDNQVIERTAARDEYVDALLAIAGAKPQMDLALAPLFLRKRHLKQRVISIFKEVRMSRTRLISRLAVGLVILAAACWVVSGTFPLAAAPQVSSDAVGVTVDVGGSPLLHRAPVSYPESARKKGVQGTVIVEARLDSSGSVADARVLSGPDELRKAALESVLQWHFQGVRSETTRTVNIAFQLQAATGDPSTLIPAVSDSLRNTYGPNAPAQYKDFLAFHAQDLQWKQETLAKVTTEQAAIMERLRLLAQRLMAQQMQKERSAAGRTLKSIVISGLSDQMRGELLAKLPVHEGDILTNETDTRIAAAVQEFDEHLKATTTYEGSGEATLTITAPNYPSESAAINTSGPRLVRQPRPVYPQAAKDERISGVVKLSAIIATDGTVKKLQLISGHPLLVQSAIDAVSQWVYEPALLNGNAVEVTTEISVNFTLSDMEGLRETLRKRLIERR